MINLVQLLLFLLYIFIEIKFLFTYLSKSFYCPMLVMCLHYYVAYTSRVCIYFITIIKFVCFFNTNALLITFQFQN